MNPWEKLKTLPPKEQRARVLAARQAVIDAKAAQGQQYGWVVEKGILGGQWDGGSVVGQYLF